MALKSGRVGVAPDQVDVYGKIKDAASSSNMEIRVDEDGKPQWREKGTEDWQNFDGGAPVYLLDDTVDRVLYIVVSDSTGAPLSDDVNIRVYKDADKSASDIVKMKKTASHSAVTCIAFDSTKRSNIYYIPRSVSVNTNANNISASTSWNAGSTYFNTVPVSNGAVTLLNVYH